MDQPDEMTPAQRQAIAKAWELLTEHFDSVLLAVDFETTANGELQNAHAGYWHGGSMSAIGLAEFAKDRILQNKVCQSSDPGED